ncbi:MAG: carbohydrate-binding protein [Reichenbachiella sp.]
MKLEYCLLKTLRSLKESMNMKSLILLFLSIVWSSISINAQYLHVEGKRILDKDENNLVLRGIGLGGWMLQEGYMLRTWGAQHELEDRIEDLIGEEKKDEFYAEWLANHCTKRDIDSMASWGFNSVRLPMHFKLFTPPIEEEAVEGEITWLEDGFVMVDNLLSWCEANEMYLILDLHAAPGGQGENADISDYDPTKPSLWESDFNKDKMVALWRKLAERYADEPYMGGYDLINETNWGFENHSGDPNGCNQSSNAPLWDIQRRAIEAIREVDQNHLVIIEGNCWGNNYNGLPDQLWDDNLVISYHKYWNANDQGSLGPHLETQNKWNVPIWLGETGENSNVWFTDAIELLEANNFGWSWWPQKKMGGNNVQEIEINEGYQDILDYWNNPESNPKPSESEAYASLMGIAENLKAENNTYHFDVVDAMMRQPYEKTALPFKENLVLEETTKRLFFTDYDLGTQDIAYSDEDFTNETGQPGGAGWNLGGRYRNDGVDIEACEDQETNGFNVGWTIDREWMNYTVDVDAAGVYNVDFRYAGVNDGVAKLFVNGDDQTGEIVFPKTGGYQTWESTLVEDVILEEGKNVIKFYIVKGASNLNFMDITYAMEVSELGFKAVSAITSESGGQIFFNVNKDLDPASISKDGFMIIIDGEQTDILMAEVREGGQKSIALTIDKQIKYESEIEMSYSGTSVKSNTGEVLESIDNLEVASGLPIHYSLPGKVNAEDFFVNNGFVLEKTEDIGGGEYNLGYTNSGDYADYHITIPEGGNYYVQARTACPYNAGEIEFQQLSLDEELISSVRVDVPITGGWQTWRNTDPFAINLEEGRSILRMKIIRDGININYFRFTKVVLSLDDEVEKKSEISIYPNPASHMVTISTTNGHDFQNSVVSVLSMDGKILKKELINQQSFKYEINTANINSGMYILEIRKGSDTIQQRLIINY